MSMQGMAFSLQQTRKTGAVFRSAFHELLRNQPLQMAAATAFFTTFALPSILIIITQVAGLLINPEAMREQLFDHLSGMVGADSIEQIMNVVEEMKSLAQNWYLTAGGVIFLFFVATTLFKVIKNSINQIWKIKPVTKRSFGEKLKGRLPSIFVILVAGVLFLVGMLLETMQTVLGRYVDLLPETLAFFLNGILNYVVSLVVVTLWFCILFRYIPDARAPWKIALAGGLVTGVLFSIGKFLLQRLLVAGNVTTLYGASGSFVLILLFVFYSSFLLYYGAAFIMAWADFKDKDLHPLPGVVRYEVKEVETNS